ncbi:uncharacterized protein LOC114311507 [Camellia sinensis]|uniref:uncharacterized protein LOC114311507 n=1 Tax=Camellia sinensis TaxID=4442 RepID=UPI0010367B11|nr:uncharacterized protein LOC114311507 [Camellia sinensis]
MALESANLTVTKIWSGRRSRVLWGGGTYIGSSRWTLGRRVWCTLVSVGIVLRIEGVPMFVGFPYASLSSTPPTPTSSPITTWIPPHIRVVSPNPQPPLPPPFEVVVPQQLPCDASTSSVVLIPSPNPPPDPQTDATNLPSSSTPT